MRFIFILLFILAFFPFSGGMCHIQSTDLSGETWYTEVECDWKDGVENWEPTPGLIMPWDEVIT